MQKKKTYRSKKYMDFVKGLECCVDSPLEHCEGEVVPHHTETGGVGMKGPDLSCVPLCNKHHQGIHAGKKTFEEVYSFDFNHHVKEANQAYIEHLEGKK